MAENRTEQLVTLITQYQRKLAVYLRSLVPQRADAEELLQEVNLFIWRKADEYELGTDFGAWAYKIAYYHVLSYRKKMARQKVQLSDELVEQLAVTAGGFAEQTDARQEALEECLKKLPSEDREWVKLRYQTVGSAQGVAERVGRSIKAVYRNLARIHANLFECIQRTLRLQAGT